MRLAATAPLLLLVAACTTFDGVTAESGSADNAQTGGTTTSASPTSPSSKDETGKPGASEDGPVAGEANPNASAPSCAQKHGGSTCGPDGKSDCCAVATQGNVKLGKYMITAGRMRSFIDKVNGDVAGFVKGLGADKWKAEWTSDALPTDRASADVALGPAGKKACEQGDFTGHTYWTPKTDGDFSDFDQATLDEKALNCVPWPLAQALCAFDGGHLATVKDLRAAFTNDDTTKFPWGDEGLDADAPDPGERLNIEFGFVTDNAPANPAHAKNGQPVEVSFFIAPPGRFPKGDNRSGIADAAGNLLEWVGDGPRQFVWKADFEHHGANAVTFNGLNGKSIWMDKETTFGLSTGAPWTWGTSQLAGNAGTAAQKDGYYAIGGRCAF